MKIFFLLLFSLTNMGFSTQTSDTVLVKKSMILMGTSFEISIVAPTLDMGYRYIEEAVSEVKRIEKLISSWDADSETSKINKNAGVAPVRVSEELFNLIKRSKKIAEITDGAFDISYASMDNIWKYDGTMERMPTDSEIRSSVRYIGYKNVELNTDNHTVFLKQKGMRIGFGAIGKGYAADKVKELLRFKGVKGGIVNASGDLNTWGTRKSGENWTVGIINPLDRNTVFTQLPIVESAVATSGNYEKYILFEGERYSHIIDPRTGYPVRGLTSVSVFAKSAELCDALATAIFVMGKDTGIHFVDQLQGVEAVLVDSNNKICRSSGITFDTEN